MRAVGGLVALLVVVGTTAGCAPELDAGFAIALTLELDDSVPDEELGRVAGFAIASAGDEAYRNTVSLPRACARVERLLYRPLLGSRSVSIEVTAVADDERSIARGATALLALAPGETTSARVVLSAGVGVGDAGVDAPTGAPDLLAPDDLAMGDLAGADLAGADLAKLPTISHQGKAEAIGVSASATITTSMFSPRVEDDQLVACYIDYESDTAEVTGVVDSVGNVYARAVGPLRATGTLAGWVDEIWYAVATTSSASQTVTATFSINVGNRQISCHAYQGLAKVAPLDEARTATCASSGTCATSEVMTAKPVELIFAAYDSFNALSVGASFTSRSTIGNDLVEDRVVSPAGAYKASAVCTGPCQGVVAVFKTP